MSRHDIALGTADVDTLNAGGTVAAEAAGVRFEFTSEDAWPGESDDPAVHRIGLSDQGVRRLGWGQPLTVLPTCADGLVLTLAVTA